MSQPIPALIADYVARHGINVPTPYSGRLTVVVDERYRVHMHTVGHDAVVLLCRLASLPPSGPVRDAWLMKAGTLAIGTLSSYAAACVVDPRELALWLQQIVQPDCGPSMDESLGQFVNALSFWAGALPRLM